jgi:hypothetical protein
MITIDKLLKEEKNFKKLNGKRATKLYLTKETYDDLVFIMGHEVETLHGMKIIISNRNGIN